MENPSPACAPALPLPREMERPPEPAGCPVLALPASSAAIRTVRDKAPGKNRTEATLATQPRDSARHTDAWCRKSNNKCPHTRESRTRRPAKTPARGSPPEVSPSRRSRAFRLAAPAAAPPAAARKQSSLEGISREEERSEPAEAMTSPLTTTRCSVSAARRQNSRGHSRFSAFCFQGELDSGIHHSEKAPVCGESVFCSTANEFRTNSTISGVT